jgi:N-acyl homoserine lactone hydrolase
VKTEKRRRRRMASLKLYPLHVGTITRQITNFCHGLEPGIADLPLICWYIEGSDKRILVDTGGGDPSSADPKHHPYKRGEDQTPENALKKIGVGCQDIDIVVVTHLHWDHIGGNGLFPNAKIILQSEELGSANPGDTGYTLVSGDVEIAKGVRAVLTPGHTPGMQGVLVECEKKPIFIASDTLPLFKNIESDLFTISDIYVDIEQYQASIKKISQLSALILPGHDFRAFEKEVY